MVALGCQERMTAPTALNERSSRSHAVFSLRIERRGTSSNLTLLDLAGREQEKMTQCRGENFRELTVINRSLFHLAHCVRALTAPGGKASSPGFGKDGHWHHFRNSKLTMVLGHALAGNSHTAVVCTISPARGAYEDSVATLRFAESVKQVRTKPVLQSGRREDLVSELQSEVQRLQGDLLRARSSRAELELHLDEARAMMDHYCGRSFWQDVAQLGSPLLDAGTPEARRLSALREEGDPDYQVEPTASSSSSSGSGSRAQPSQQPPFLALSQVRAPPCPLQDGSADASRNPEDLRIAVDLIERLRSKLSDGRQTPPRASSVPRGRRLAAEVQASPAEDRQQRFDWKGLADTPKKQPASALSLDPWASYTNLSLQSEASSPRSARAGGTSNSASDPWRGGVDTAGLSVSTALTQEGAERQPEEELLWVIDAWLARPDLAPDEATGSRSSLSVVLRQLQSQLLDLRAASAKLKRAQVPECMPGAADRAGSMTARSQRSGCATPSAAGYWNPWLPGGGASECMKSARLRSTSPAPKTSAGRTPPCAPPDCNAGSGAGDKLGALLKEALVGPQDDGWHEAAAQAAAALSRQVSAQAALSPAAAAASPVSTGIRSAASVAPPRFVKASASYYAGSVSPARAARPAQLRSAQVAQRALAGPAAPQMAQPSPRLRSPAPARAAAPPLLWALPPQTPPAQPRACTPGPHGSASPRLAPRQLASPCPTPRVAAALPVLSAVAAVPVAVPALPGPAAAPTPRAAGPLAPQLRLWQALPTDGFGGDAPSPRLRTPLRQMPSPIASPSLATRLFAAGAAASPRPPSREARSASRGRAPSAPPSPAARGPGGPRADSLSASARSRSGSCKVRL
ncbi:unnamed protein product [Prorocentrum cordatum]|uniref:Kinesin motor domain-containing protein n=1 Tax=Prorocentrum cordatum TaxID=2364126 RepID=A0ABN9RR65_9DINO|nr:unnamed protein product [Polarella glacialis]